MTHSKYQKSFCSVASSTRTDDPLAAVGRRRWHQLFGRFVQYPSSFTSSRVVEGNAFSAASKPNTQHHHQSSHDTANSSSVGSIGGATMTTITESIQSPTAAVVVSKHRKPVSRIVVTKVQGYRLVKLPPSVPAAVLLLQWHTCLCARHSNDTRIQH